MLRSRLLSPCLLLALVSLIPGASGRAVERFIRGDANVTGDVDISDPIRILSKLFSGIGAIPCTDAADADDNGMLNIGDAIWLLSFSFTGGAPMPAPFPACGVDPTADSLGCEAFGPCPQPLGPVEVFGRVFRPDGSGVEEATVRVVNGAADAHWEADGGGNFFFTRDFGASTQVELAVSAQGHTSSQKRLQLEEGQTRYVLGFTLLPVSVSVVDENPADGAQVAVSGAGSTPGTLTLPAGAIATTNPVRIEMTTLDPTRYPTAAPGVNLLAKVTPGEENGFSSEAPLESFGMVEVRITDTTTGESIHELLAPATLTQRLPEVYQGKYQSGDRIPLWYFDESSGLWTEEGMGEVFASADDGLYFKGEVMHFSWWNADRLFSRTCVSLKISNMASLPPSFEIGAEGITYSGRFQGSVNCIPVLVSQDGKDSSRLAACVLGIDYYLKESPPGVLTLTSDAEEALVIKNPTALDAQSGTNSFLGNFELFLNMPPVISVRATPRYTCKNDLRRVSLSANAFDFDGPITDISWELPGGQGTITRTSFTTATFDAAAEVAFHKMLAKATDSDGNVSTTRVVIHVAEDCAGALFSRGDADGNGRLEISDMFLIVNSLLMFPAFDPDSGFDCTDLRPNPNPQPLDCEDAADVNDDGRITCEDAAIIHTFLFLGGAAPSAPFPGCGVDPTPDSLSCAEPPPPCED